MEQSHKSQSHDDQKSISTLTVEQSSLSNSLSQSVKTHSAQKEQQQLKKQSQKIIKQNQAQQQAQSTTQPNLKQQLANNGGNFSLQDCDLSNLSKTQLIEMIQRSKQQNNELKKQILKAKDIQAKISIKSEAEEDFISNKLVQKLEQIQKEKVDIQRKVQIEEEHIQNYLHRKLQEINRERLEIEQQLEEEQNFLLSTLNKQLREVNQRKEALKKKLEREQRNKQELIDSIESEQKYLKDTLQKKLDQIQKEKESLLREIESEESERIANLQLIIERILSEKNKVEELLSQEVREKQLLVLTLENQKSNLTMELQSKIEEIKRHRIMIQRQLQLTSDFIVQGRTGGVGGSQSSDIPLTMMKLSGMNQDPQNLMVNQMDKSTTGGVGTEGSQQMTLKNKQMLIDANNSSNSSTPRTFKNKLEIEQKMVNLVEDYPQERSDSKGADSSRNAKQQQLQTPSEFQLPQQSTVDIISEEGHTKSLLQNDMEYYEQEQKRMIQKIMGLTTQLEDIKKESTKYKKMWDDVKSKLRKGDQQQRFYQEMMMMHIYKGGQIQGTGSSGPQNSVNPNVMRALDQYGKRTKNPKHQIQDSSAENSFNNDFLS